MREGLRKELYAVSVIPTTRQIWVEDREEEDGGHWATVGGEPIVSNVSVDIKPYKDGLRISLPTTEHVRDEDGWHYLQKTVHFYVKPEYETRKSTYYGGGGSNYRITFTGDGESVTFLCSAEHGHAPTFEYVSVSGYKPKKKSEYKPGMKYGLWLDDVDDKKKHIYTFVERMKPDAAAWLLNLYHKGNEVSE